MAEPRGDRSTVIPTVLYRDARALIAWWCEVFGFVPQLVVDGPDGTVAHSQLRLGGGMMMVGSVREPATEFGVRLKHPDELGGAVTQAGCLIVPDPDDVAAKAAARGATLLCPVRDEPYGGRGFAFRDPEGYRWWCGSYDPWAA
jgi:uncharacterized glyoxalase superfamily protein PhnB